MTVYRLFRLWHNQFSEANCFLKCRHLSVVLVSLLSSAAADYDSQNNNCTTDPSEDKDLDGYSVEAEACHLSAKLRDEKKTGFIFLCTKLCLLPTECSHFEYRHTRQAQVPVTAHVITMFIPLIVNYGTSSYLPGPRRDGNHCTNTQTRPLTTRSVSRLTNPATDNGR
jgi:hypothetical protein